MGYSVLYDPVVEVEHLDGHREKIGFYKAIVQAHQIRDILAVSPLAKYALLRLLIAFLMDMLRLADVYDRRELLESGSFCKEKLDRYIFQCERDGTRFDLFDSKHPFMQSTFDAAIDEGSIKSVAILFSELPSGNNHVHFDHRLESEHSVYIYEAFQSLCSTYIFCPPMTQDYPSSVNNTPPLFTIVQGDTLFSTLVVNMLSMEECGNIPLGSPPWREVKPVVPKEVYVSVCMLEALTWLPRRVTLIPDDNGMVSMVYFQQGRNFKGNNLWRDPHVPYEKKGKWLSTLKPQIGRELWRDLGALSMSKEGMYQPALVVAQTRDLWSNATALLNVWCVGLITKNAALFGWTEGRLTVPALLLENDELAYQFQYDMDMLEQQQNDVHYIINKHLGEEIAFQGQALYLQYMKEYVLNRHLVSLVNMDVSDSGKALLNAMKNGLFLVLSRIVEQDGNDVKALLRQREVKRYLLGKFSKQRKDREKLEN